MLVIQGLVNVDSGGGKMGFVCLMHSRMSVSRQALAIELRECTARGWLVEDISATLLCDSRIQIGKITS